MRIGGYQACSLCDFPGKVAAVIFAQGCNFRCPYCHNRRLLPAIVAADCLIPSSTILEKLHRRRGVLDGVVLCGGEPTLQSGLPDFISEVTAWGILSSWIRTEAAAPCLGSFCVGSAELCRDGYQSTLGKI
jgi:pyruvate formate lyase activating enzyme